MSALFGRYCKLVVIGAEEGIDLSEFRIVFDIHQNDFEAPNHAEIRVYNLSRATMDKIQGKGGEFSRVHLEAGYQDGNYATIFEGTISQLHRGRENNTETFLEILAMDGDSVYNDAFVAETMSKRTTLKERADKLAQLGGTTIASPPPSSNAKYWSNPSLRGKVLFGMLRNEMRSLTKTVNSSWSIQNGQIQIVEMQGYLPGDVVVLNASTGLIGVPTQTDQGVRLNCLLNPKIKIGGTVQIDNNDINQTVLNSMIPHSQWAGLVFVSPLSADSKYRVLVTEHNGDTRGHNWYTKVIGMAIDSSGNIVLAR